MLSPFIRSGRYKSVPVFLSVMTVTGPVRYEMSVATEIISASTPQPLNKNRKINDTAKLKTLLDEARRK